MGVTLQGAASQARRAGRGLTRNWLHNVKAANGRLGGGAAASLGWAGGTTRAARPTNVFATQVMQKGTGEAEPKPAPRLPRYAISWPQVTVCFSHTADTIRADNDVIDHIHTHQLPRFYQRFGHVQIFLAWRKRSSRVIMRYDHRV